MAFFYNRGLREVLAGNKNLSSATVKFMLVTNTYTPNHDHEFVSFGSGDPASSELSVTNYVSGFSGAGRKTLSAGNMVFTTEHANDRVVFDYIADLLWSALGGSATIQAGIIVLNGTTDADTFPFIYVDLASPVVTNGGDFTFQFNVSGVARVTT